MSRPLTPLSFAVLAIVGEQGASAYEIVQVAERTQRLYWAGAASKLYAEPKRLAERGYLASELQRGTRRPRPHYTLTPKGRTALEEWLAEPSTFPRIQNEAVIRVFAADLAPDNRVLESVRAMRDDIADLLAAIDTRDQLPPVFPERQRHVALMRSLSRRLLEAHLDWIDEVERELQPKPAPRAAVR
jgi:DNA-binding PadR family transcriptional regulator